MSEFDLIARLFAPLTEGAPGTFRLTDDAALMTPPPGRELVLTVDALVEGVHYLADDLPEDVGARLLNVSLSDLAAKGARPEGYLVTIAVPAPADEIWLARFALGLMSAQTDHDTRLWGGDTVMTPGPRSFSLTAIGSVNEGGMIRRAGARPGDRVLVTGTIGDAALGLKLRTGELAVTDPVDSDYLKARFTHITPRLCFGTRMAPDVHAALDISDGLVSDAGHLAAASGVALAIDANKVLLSDAARAAVAGTPALLETALTGGDDYELLLAAPRDAVEGLMALAGDCGHALTDIGQVEDGTGVRIEDAAGRSMQFRKGGYAHF